MQIRKTLAAFATVAVIAIGGASTADACRLDAVINNKNSDTRIRVVHFCVQKQGTGSCRDMVQWNTELAFGPRYIDADSTRFFTLDPSRKKSATVRVRATIKNVAKNTLHHLYSSYGRCDSKHYLNYTS